MLTLTIQQGATFVRQFEWRSPGPDPTQPAILGPPINISGWSAKLQGRSKQRPDALLLFTLTVGDGLAINGPSGIVTVTITAAKSAAWTWKSAYFDLLLWNATEDDRLVQGKLVLDPQVTVR